MSSQLQDLITSAADSQLTIRRMLSPWAPDLPAVVDAPLPATERPGVHSSGRLTLKDIGLPSRINILRPAPHDIRKGPVIALTNQALDTLLVTAAMTARYRIVDVAAYPRAGHLVLPRPLLAGRRSRVALYSEISWVPNGTHVTALPWADGWRTLDRNREMLIQTFDQTREPEVPCRWNIPRALKGDISGDGMFGQYLLATLWRMMAEDAFASHTEAFDGLSVTVLAGVNEDLLPTAKPPAKRRGRRKAAPVQPELTFA